MSEERGKVIRMKDYIDAHSAHMFLECSDGVHVIPVEYIEAQIRGDDVEPLTQPILAAILNEWMNGWEPI